MGRMGNFNSSDFKKLQKELEKLKGETEGFQEHCAKKLAQGFITKAVKRTPVGDYRKEITIVAKKDSKNHKKGDTYTKKINPSGKMGGTLRRGWVSKTHEEAESGNGRPNMSDIESYVQALTLKRVGNISTIEIVNPVEYASYVENGHRTANHKGWIQGKFMLKRSADEVQAAAPRVIQAETDKWLGGAFK